MTRKLLMNNYVKNGLMPVTDGLIGWYDARYRNSDDTYLIDRSNNGNHISCFNNNNIISNDFIVVNHTAYSNQLDYTNYINGEVTILYYVDCIVTGRLLCMSGHYETNLAWWISPTVDDTINVWYKNNQYINCSNLKTRIPIGKNMIGLSISAMKIKVYLNGVLIYDATTVINLKELKLGLFGISGYPNNINYKYYSSYVYNRVLTDEEIMQNYQYEQSIKRGE